MALVHHANWSKIPYRHARMVLANWCWKSGSVAAGIHVQATDVMLWFPRIRLLILTMTARLMTISFKSAAGRPSCWFWT